MFFENRHCWSRKWIENQFHAAGGAGMHYEPMWLLEMRSRPEWDFMQTHVFDITACSRSLPRGIILRSIPIGMKDSTDQACTLIFPKLKNLIEIAMGMMWDANLTLKVPAKYRVLLRCPIVKYCTYIPQHRPPSLNATRLCILSCLAKIDRSPNPRRQRSTPSPNNLCTIPLTIWPWILFSRTGRLPSRKPNLLAISTFRQLPHGHDARLLCITKG